MGGAVVDRCGLHTLEAHVASQAEPNEIHFGPDASKQKLSLEFKVNSMKATFRKLVIAILRALGIEDNVRALLQAARVRGVSDDMIMPRYFFHSPMDYGLESHPPRFDPPVVVAGEPFPLPPAHCRPGYSPDDDVHYLKWGRSDHDELVRLIARHRGMDRDMTILDFGCSSGRVLRHFWKEHQELGWKLAGTDIQALLVEWMRQHFPKEIEIMSAMVLPHLPFRDSSIDVIYGISVFTHTKYLWDMWLAEFKRVLKPGGLCIQSVQCETAWRFYHAHRTEGWVRGGHPESMLAKPELDEDYFLYGDGRVSQQTFFKEEVIKRYWGRYMDVVDFLPPPSFSYQNWIVVKNP